VATFVHPKEVKIPISIAVEQTPLDISMWHSFEGAVLHGQLLAQRFGGMTADGKEIVADSE